MHRILFIYVRTTGKPAFHHVKTYRLNAHSKGDDTRDPEEVELYCQKDYLNNFAFIETKILSTIYFAN